MSPDLPGEITAIATAVLWERDPRGALIPR
jgi:hypothetical protein